MGVMSRGNSGHKAKGVLSLPHNQEFGWNLHLNLNLNFRIRNLEFGSQAASAVVPVGPVALPLVVRCDVITKG